MAPRHSAFWGRVGSTETGRTPERVWEGMRRCRLVVTGQSLFGGVHLEVVCQLVRAAQRGGVPAVHFVGGAGRFPGDPFRS